MSKEVYIISAVRTPMGSFMGAFANVPATVLGSTAIKGAMDKGGVKPEMVNEVFMGMYCKLELDKLLHVKLH
jgi:acetyl-CoA C-acetyltransferase